MYSGTSTWLHIRSSSNIAKLHIRFLICVREYSPGDCINNFAKIYRNTRAHLFSLISPLPYHLYMWFIYFYYICIYIYLCTYFLYFTVSHFTKYLNFIYTLLTTWALSTHHAPHTHNCSVLILPIEWEEACHVPVF